MPRGGGEGEREREVELTEVVLKRERMAMREMWVCNVASRLLCAVVGVRCLR
jgi:hypothetical protein